MFKFSPAWKYYEHYSRGYVKKKISHSYGETMNDKSKDIAKVKVGETLGFICVPYRITYLQELGWLV